LGQVISATEATTIVRPLGDTVMFKAAAAAPTPMEPGTVEVHGRVTLDVEITQ
jgi:hypothetical protein